MQIHNAVVWPFPARPLPWHLNLALRAFFKFIMQMFFWLILSFDLLGAERLESYVFWDATCSHLSYDISTNISTTSVKWVWRKAWLCTQLRLSFESGPVLFYLILRSFFSWTPTLLCILSRASKLQRKWGWGTLPVYTGTSLAVSLTQICLSDWSFSNELDGRFQPTQQQQHMCHITI